MPDVILVNQNGEAVKFKALVEGDKPVILDFIYGTCTTICPVLSAGFSTLQKKLGAEAEAVQLISVTIDPEHDTPKVMRDYLQRYRAKPGWDFLTGSRKDIEALMTAFGTYVSDKRYHQPLTFIRAVGESRWVKVQGLMGSSDLMAEYKKASAN